MRTEWGARTVPTESMSNIDVRDEVPEPGNLGASSVVTPSISNSERAALSRLGDRLAGLRRFEEAGQIFELLVLIESKNSFYN